MTDQSIDPVHAAELAASVITPDVAAQRGYRTLYAGDESRALLTELNFSSTLRSRPDDEIFPLLLIPVYSAMGEVISHQAKPRTPTVFRGRERKYESPAGNSVRVDVPAFTRTLLGDLSVALWHTEGMKKTDSLVSHKRAAIGLTGVFNWRNKMGALGDWEDIPLKGREHVICFDSDAHGNRQVQSAMRRMGAWLVHRGATAVHYVVVPQEVNGVPVKGVDDYFAAGGTLAGLQQVSSLAPPSNGSDDGFFTDALMADTVADEVLTDRFCWSAQMGWMQYTGARWTEVSDETVIEHVRAWASGRFASVLDDQKRNQSKNLSTLMDGWRGVLSNSKLVSVLKLCRGIVETDARNFDADPDLLNTPSGVVDLTTGDVRPGTPDDLMTRITGAEYRPGYRHPHWEKLLDALPEESTREFLRDRLGQSLTGHSTPDDLLLISHGTGSNGKSSVNSAVYAGFGDYGLQMTEKTIMGDSGPGNASTDLMDLRGVRYAVLEETPEARRLDSNRLKKVVGTPFIRARKLYKDNVTFLASHSVFISTNYRPVVTETDHGTWRRLALLSWPLTFRSSPSDVTQTTDRLKDPDLKYAFQDPDVQAAALAWAVEGALAWYARNKVMLPLPPSVNEDTEAWRKETDIILAFADDRLMFGTDKSVPTQEVYREFVRWAEDRGYHKWSESTFAARLMDHEIATGHRVERRQVREGGQRNMRWLNLALRPAGVQSAPVMGANPFNPGATA